MKIIIHLISDSSGQTVKSAARSAISQFSKLEVKEYNWLLIKNKELLQECLNKIKEKPGIVLYTLVDQELQNILKDFCYRIKIPCISVIGKIVREISTYLGVNTEDNPNSIRRLDEDYFDKMEAIDYTLRHDDGQLTNEINQADIILIGPSRTSKTPTSVYLAYNGFKTANIPYILNTPLPDYLEKDFPALIVGLVINPARLIEIRQTRMNYLQVKEISDYTNLERAKEECSQVKRICLKNNWPVIDVSRRSIEETSAAIMKFYYDYKKYPRYDSNWTNG